MGSCINSNNKNQSRKSKSADAPIKQPSKNINETRDSDFEKRLLNEGSSQETAHSKSIKEARKNTMSNAALNNAIINIDDNKNNNVEPLNIKQNSSGKSPNKEGLTNLNSDSPNKNMSGKN